MAQIIATAPSFNLADTIYINLTSTEATAIELIPPYPHEIMVQGGGGVEATGLELQIKDATENLVTELKKIGVLNCRIEGRDSSDWKLVDAHDVIVHIFHPEKREFYDLEKMWSEEIPKEKAMI